MKKQIASCRKYSPSRKWREHCEEYFWEPLRWMELKAGLQSCQKWVFRRGKLLQWTGRVLHAHTSVL